MDPVAIDENTNKQLHKMLTDLAQFMALYEQSEDRFKIQKEEMDQAIANFKTEIHSELTEIREAAAEVKEIMDEAGAARWRLAAEQAMKAGAEHLTSIKEATNVYKKLAEDSVTRLEHVSLSTEKRVSNALNHVNEENTEVVEDFRRRSEEIYVELENTTVNTISVLRKMIRWLRFDRIGIAVIAGLLSAFLTSVYVNAEWPWESHAQSTKQRLVGKTILTVWPALSKQKQEEINHLLGTKI
jgi:hypothetical protein